MERRLHRDDLIHLFAWMDGIFSLELAARLKREEPFAFSVKKAEEIATDYGACCDFPMCKPAIGEWRDDRMIYFTRSGNELIVRPEDEDDEDEEWFLVEVSPESSIAKWLTRFGE